MRVAIVGSRAKFIKEPNVVKRMIFGAVAELPKDAIIVSGGASGVDTWAREAASEYGLVYIEYPAFWRTPEGQFNPRAGFERNTFIVEQCDELWAYWDGESHGTKDSIDKAKRAGKRVFVKIVARKEIADA